MSWTPPDELVERVRSARRVVVLTGAGVSAESGLATFRDPETGMWNNVEIERVARREGFLRDPAYVWSWYAERAAQMRAAQPNPAHLALAEIERRVPAFTLVTQNIDGLHQRAGSRNVLELHGNVARTKCFDEDTLVDSWTPTDEIPPRCPRCGGLLRPDVVWFGELVAQQELAQAKAAIKECDLFLSVGTSGVVEPAASMQVWAMQWGATVALINLDIESRSVPRLHKINGRAGEVLPALVAAAWGDAQDD